MNFSILSQRLVSTQFTGRGITDFEGAMKFIRDLPYKRNADKNDPLAVFNDSCGTCSTKHATLLLLAGENNINDIRLMLGIFKMNEINMPAAAHVLRKYGLDHIPEAHNYLRAGNIILDCTNSRSPGNDFINDLLEEIEIMPSQITDFKVKHHRQYLEQWLGKNAKTGMNIEELWSVREECIRALAGEQ